MRIVGLPKRFYYISNNRPAELSLKAHQRLYLLKTWQRLRAEGFSGQKAAEILRLPRSTLYRWQKRLKEQGLSGLEDGTGGRNKCAGHSGARNWLRRSCAFEKPTPGWARKSCGRC